MRICKIYMHFIAFNDIHKFSCCLMHSSCVPHFFAPCTDNNISTILSVIVFICKWFQFNGIAIIAEKIVNTLFFRLRWCECECCNIFYCYRNGIAYTFVCLCDLFAYVRCWGFFYRQQITLICAVYALNSSSHPNKSLIKI